MNHFDLDSFKLKEQIIIEFMCWMFEYTLQLRQQTRFICMLHVVQFFLFIHMDCGTLHTS